MATPHPRRSQTRYLSTPDRKLDIFPETHGLSSYQTYRQHGLIADDEIVLKKDEYKELKKYRTDWLNDEKMHLQAELEDTEFELGCSNRLFQKVCEEKKELEKQLEQYKNKAKHYYNECKLYGSACYIDSDLEDNDEQR